MINPDWQPWYKDMVQIKFESDKNRLNEQVRKMVDMGLWSSNKAHEVAKKAQGLDRLQISDAVNKMHRILRSM